MTATPKFAHVVFQTSNPTEMRDWYCTVLAGHVVFQNDSLCFITYDESTTASPCSPRRSR
ncbi:hypothetical protein [Streptomyces sp. KL116D]|uniref:hypothetical protein n=1 Tax=Streptomyces sp. KL116D TaxID=3045152 RepID=UPI0035562D55